MSKFASNVAAVLLAPVILSATCLLCFFQVTPVLAAATVKTQGPVCEESPSSSDSSASTPIISANDSLVFVSNISDASGTSHDSSCKRMMEHVGIKVNTTDLNSGENHSVVFHSTFIENPKQVQNAVFKFPQKIFPVKENFLTGTVIKRE